MDSTTRQGGLPARTPEEISGRLYTLAKKIDEKLDAGETIHPDTLRAIALRLRSYAIRLRGSAAPFR